MTSKIDTVSSRERLKLRREPYWHRISKGNYLGVRKMTSDGYTWMARSLDEGTRKQVYKALGDLSTLPDHQRFDAASRAAREWFEHLGKGGSVKTMTVAETCKKYVQHLRDTRGIKASDDAQARFRRHVLNDVKFAAIELTKLTPVHVETWRGALRAKPTPTGPNKGCQRSDSAMNRDLNAFRAALNLAFKDGVVTSNFAWRAKLAPAKNADKRRDVYLDLRQRRKLIEAATPALAAFLRCLALVPLRPGAMAALTTGNFDKRLGVLTVGKDKAGSDRKLHLPDITAKLFAAHCKDKLPDAYIFTNSAGRPWGRDTWGYQFRQAAQRAGMPEKSTTYSVRHSVITDLIHAGVDSLTVAQLAGTSVAMIEKHYGHLTRNHARSALAALAL
ncbi:tyrosine-type recombinase/integrase [Acidovorax sp. LjRoot129]|uniref:tyrosine-type recombinase/integrase n=1 Tax=Acidovorax sp. LjRoot129 TaxID=3342260 RepID=UPI003ECDEDD4